MTKKKAAHISAIKALAAAIRAAAESRSREGEIVGDGCAAPA
jgi:hypothetical protein